MPNLLTREKIEAIYEYVTDILTRTGVEFDMESARDLFKKNGARIDGKRVYIHPSLLSKTLDLMPKHQYEPGHIKRLAAAAPFSNAPMILDDFGQSRRGTLGEKRSRAAARRFLGKCRGGGQKDRKGEARINGESANHRVPSRPCSKARERPRLQVRPARQSGEVRIERCRSVRICSSGPVSKHDCGIIEALEASSAAWRTSDGSGFTLAIDYGNPAAV